MNECFQLLPYFDARFVPAFSVLFVPLVLVNFSSFFPLFFVYSFPPTIFFISYIIYIRAVLSYLLYFSFYSQLQPYLFLCLFSFFIFTYFSLFILFSCFLFRISVSVCYFLLLASLASSYDALCLCVFFFVLDFRTVRGFCCPSQKLSTLYQMQKQCIH